MAQAALLPNGEQQFFDDNGDPLSGGSVGFYIPSTTTPKTTWQDSTQATPNANPVVLDAAGRAIIYGSGVYRQIVKDVDGNTIWDQLTTGAPVFNSSGTSIVANTTTDLGSTNSNNVTVTGNTTITNFGASASLASPIYFVTFTGSAKIVNSASIICLGSQDIKTRPGAFAIMQYMGSSVWQIMAFQYPDGTTISWSGTETAVPSAATVDLGAQLTNFVRVTGSTGPITSFGANASLANPIYVVLFDSTPTVQNGANIVIPSGSDLVMAAADAMLVFYKGAGVWQVLGRISTASGGGGGTSPCIVADTRNSKVLFASNTTLTLSVDEVIAKTSLGGTAYLGVSLTSTLNFASTGANGLDTGAIAASTFYGLYWIYNPGSNTWASLASLSFTAPTLPSGYTAFALIAVVPTNSSSQVTAGYIARQRSCSFQPITISTSLANHASLTSQSIAAAIPSIAQACSGLLLSTFTSFGAITLEVAADSGGTAAQIWSGNGSSAAGGTPSNAVCLTFLALMIITAQTIYYIASTSGTTYKLYITGFSI